MNIHAGQFEPNAVGDRGATTGGITNPWLVHTSVIEEVRNEIDETRTYQLRLIDSEAASRYRFEPGQFNMLYLPGSGEIAISHSGHPENNGYEIVHTIRRVGRVTDAFFQLRRGDRVGVRGPFGSSWPNAELIERDVIVVAGGLGLAPLRPLLYAILRERERFGKLTLLLGARTPDLFLYRDEFDNWRERGFVVEQIVDRPDASWTGSVGFVPLLLEQMEAVVPERTRIVTCGPEAMMHGVAIASMQRGVAADSIWLSLERNMQCAVGFCGHCQLGEMFVCRQGPVFRFDAVASLIKVKDL